MIYIAIVPHQYSHTYRGVRRAFVFLGVYWLGAEDTRSLTFLELALASGQNRLALAQPQLEKWNLTCHRGPAHSKMCQRCCYPESLRVHQAFSMQRTLHTEVVVNQAKGKSRQWQSSSFTSRNARTSLLTGEVSCIIPPSTQCNRQKLGRKISPSCKIANRWSTRNRKPLTHSKLENHYVGIFANTIRCSAGGYEVNIKSMGWNMVYGVHIGMLIIS